MNIDKKLVKELKGAGAYITQVFGYIYVTVIESKIAQVKTIVDKYDTKEIGDFGYNLGNNYFETYVACIYNK